MALHTHLHEFKKTVQGKARLAVEIFANAMLVIPKTLMANSGLDIQDCLLSIISEHEKEKKAVGVDLMTGSPMSPAMEGVWDNYNVKKQMLTLVPLLVQQLLLVDEVIRAGKQMGASA